MVNQITRIMLTALSLALLAFVATSCFERFSKGKDVEVTDAGTPADTETKVVDGAATEASAEAPAAAPTEGGDEEVKLIQFTPGQLKEHGVKVVEVGPGEVGQTLTLPGEVAVNADKVGHVLPRLEGTLQKLTKNIGDHVNAGELLAVIDSRELAEAKSTYLTAVEEVKIAQVNYDREKHLYDKGISAKTEFINADNALSEAKIQQHAAEQSLSALGVNQRQLDALRAAPNSLLTRYNLYAPTNGRVLEKNVSLGEMVSTSTEMYLIADLSSVWVNLSVGQKDLPRIKEGQSVTIRFNPAAGGEASPPTADSTGIPDAHATIKYIDALISEDTRAATARVILSNGSGHWRPGMFVSGIVNTSNATAAVVVPLSAVIPYEGNQTVFVEKGEAFEPRTVSLGRQTASQAEVLSGLQAGELVVSDGTFMVKADLGKSEASEE